jgi:hypothetical protein
LLRRATLLALLAAVAMFAALLARFRSALWIV